MANPADNANHDASATIPMALFEDRRLNATDLAVYAALSLHGVDTAEFSVSHDALANLAKIKKREVGHSTGRLKEAGWISKTRDGRRPNVARYRVFSKRTDGSEAIQTIDMLHILFETAGLDRLTGAGEVSASSALEAFEAMRGSPCRAALEAAGVASFHRTPKYPVRWFAAALRKFGLKLEGVGETAERHRLYRTKQNLAWTRLSF